MRVTVSHNKSRQEAIKLVDQAADQILRPQIPGPVQITDVQKHWEGDVMTFSLRAGMGILNTPINGKVYVSDKDVVVEAELPAFLKQLVPEKTIEASMQSRVKGLLT